MGNKTLLSDIVAIRPRFMRSVHLERDFYVPGAADDYIVTRNSRILLDRLSRGVNQPAYRAQSISGPYGSGKSALGLYFTRLLDRKCELGLRATARGMLGELASQFVPTDGQGYLPILVTGTRESISGCLIRGLVRSLQESCQTKLLGSLRSRHGDVLDSGKASTREVVQVFEHLAELAVKSSGFLGVVVVVDELGKLLEHSALHPDEGDIHVLQEFAEAAARSYDRPLWLLTILHQSFSQYAAGLGRRQQAEWDKVHQRFYDNPCALEGIDAFQLVASALVSSASELIRNNEHISEAAYQCRGLAPDDMVDEFATLALASYPLHPTVLLALPSLVRRFGQNERSLFSFLAAEEPFSLASFAKSHEFSPDDPPFIRLPDLFDYTCHTLIRGMPPISVAHVWSETEVAMARLRDSEEPEIALAKAVGVLGLIGETGDIHASEQVLEFALCSTQADERALEEAIQNLKQKHILVHRRFKRCYKLSEGSEVDIDERLHEAYKHVSTGSVITDVARTLCPEMPVAARRHSYQTGMLRMFSVIPSTTENLRKVVEEETSSDGRLVQCLAENTEQYEDALSELRNIAKSDLIVALTVQVEELADAARDVWALDWVQRNTPELSRDEVARRELGDRRLEAQGEFRKLWQALFRPGAPGTAWFWTGQEQDVRGSKDLSILVSRACDETFPHAPRIQNELINRHKLSSSAASARRNLVVAMLECGHLPGLGIEGCPPERSIYESLLLRTGIHRQDENGDWRFGKPNDLDAGLREAWDEVLRFVHADDLVPRSVDNLFEQLCAPPYGVADGFAPVLLFAVLLANSETVALYQDAKYIPKLESAAAELLMKRPEGFAVLAYEVSGEREAVVRRFAKGYGVPVGVLPVVQSLYSRMGTLERYVESTSSLPDDARAVRDAIARSKSPERLLFAELPEALGCKPFGAGDTQLDGNFEAFFGRLNQAFSTLLECYPLLLERIRKGLLSVFDLAPDEENWRHLIAQRAASVADAATDVKIRTLGIRAKDTQLPEDAYLESVGAGMVGQPPNRWSRADEESFERMLPSMRTKINTLDAQRELKTSLSDGEDGYLLSVALPDGEALRKVLRVSSDERHSVESAVEVLLASFNGQPDQRIKLAALAEAARRLLLSQ